MASGIINWIIDKYLNNILEINKDLTKSSIFTGEIQMANLTIKPAIFTLLNLAFFEFIYGYVGKLKINVKRNVKIVKRKNVDYIIIILI